MLLFSSCSIHNSNNYNNLKLQSKSVKLHVCQRVFSRKFHCFPVELKWRNSFTKGEFWTKTFFKYLNV